jgi:ribosomal protein L16/L10AE
MFGDLFGGVTAEQVNQSNQVHAVNYLTLTLVLIEKGIITADEIEKARVQATHFVEQEWARKRKELDEAHPGLRQMFGKVLGADSSV